MLNSAIVMPDEGELHERTWMAFVANENIWQRRQIPAVKKNLALMATTIAKYEPVSLLVSRRDRQQAQRLLGDPTLHRYPIDLLEVAVDDLWLRDTGPTFVIADDGKKVAIDFNFNGWGNKQQHRLDSQVARQIASAAAVELLNTELVLEGGCFEVDGQGTAIIPRVVFSMTTATRAGQKQPSKKSLRLFWG